MRRSAQRMERESAGDEKIRHAKLNIQLVESQSNFRNIAPNFLNGGKNFYMHSTTPS